MILLLLGTALTGIELYQIFNAGRMVDAALLDAQLKLAADGGVSPQVERLVRHRIAADGGKPGRVTVSGTRAHTPFGELVELHVLYQQPYSLTGLLPGSAGAEHGLLEIARTATTMSGWQP
jgi:hypothetical protein